MLGCGPCALGFFFQVRECQLRQIGRNYPYRAREPTHSCICSQRNLGTIVDGLILPSFQQTKECSPVSCHFAARGASKATCGAEKHRGRGPGQKAASPNSSLRPLQACPWQFCTPVTVAEVHLLQEARTCVWGPGSLMLGLLPSRFGTLRNSISPGCLDPL